MTTSLTIFHRLPCVLACSAVVLSMVGCAGHSVPAVQGQAESNPAYSVRAAQAAQPALAQYSLVQAANLPHLAWSLKGQSTALGLTEEQRTALTALVLAVRDQLQPRLAQAQATEQDIAQAVLAGATAEQLVVRLNRLQLLKLEAAQVQLDATQRIRTTLSEPQFAQLRQRALAAAAAPAMPEYSLLLPASLPHLMQFVEQLNASAEHQQALSRYAKEQVRPALLPRLQQAQQLEQEIGRAALDGRSPQELAPQLQQLATLKREAAEIHLRCIAQVRQTLPPDQYARLVALATAQPKTP